MFRCLARSLKGLGLTGHPTRQQRWMIWPVACCAALLLAGCESDKQANGSSGLGLSATQSARAGQDVERPDIFAVTDRGLWDGRPSLGGVWVAHPDVRAPERVIIRNQQTGESIIGALFRRERDNPGPSLQVSSDAAEALAMLAGAPTELSVTALRRVETAPEPVVPDMPDVADGAEVALASPDTIEQTPLAPVAAVAETAVTDTVVVDLPPAAPAAAVAAPDSATASAGLPPAPLVQVGVFGVRTNADAAASRLTAAGLTATVLPLQNSWRVVAGPVPDAATLTRIKGLGFADAYLIRD